jgi:integrase
MTLVKRKTLMSSWTFVFLTAATGLRVSEAMGLKWSDVDFGRVTNLGRAVVHQHVGEMKTEASDKPVPMDGALAVALLDWSKQALYRQPEDWVFASPKMKGKQPYWPETPLKCFVQPSQSVWASPSK